MFSASRSSAPTRHAGALVSHVLLQEGDAPSALTVTWVDVPPGASQALHHHEPEQVYVVVRGTGLMHVGGEERHVTVGDLVLAPSGVEHGIENTGDDVLQYVSAATPSFRVTDFYDGGAG